MLNANGELELSDPVKKAIDRIKHFEPEEGYYLAFSGGKDSIVVKDLMIKAGVKFDSHYNITTVDPPELIYYMREHHKDVEFHKPEETMWRLIERKKLPPTRMVRYCCDVLKEGGGEGRFVVTGVRRAESGKRSKRLAVEFDAYGSNGKKAKSQREKFYLLNDNDEKRNMIETCVIKGKNILNPIIDWSDTDVWEYIKQNNLSYCKLYDEGFKRLGCVGCPLNPKNQEKELEIYPKFKQAYIRAFDRMIKRMEVEEPNKKRSWKNGEDVMRWWLDQ